MRPNLALREPHSMLYVRLLFRRQTFTCQPGATTYRGGAPSQGHAALSFARYSTTSRIRSPRLRDLCVGVGFCSSDISRPYEYTDGRWLKQDKLQHDARHLDFDFAALSAKAVALCPRARSVSACIKLEGGFNTAFLYTMDSGARIVARVPTHIAGPRRLTTNSEVATIAYSERLCHPWLQTSVF
jgi:hypothetical protein